MSGGDDRTLLLVAETDERARRLGTALEDDRPEFIVEWYSDTVEASDRLAWPDIDYLIIALREDAAAFVERVRESHPILPIVYYGPDQSTGEIDCTVVTDDRSGDVSTLADHVEGRLAERDRHREAYSLNGDGEAIAYPNVDEQRLEDLLGGDIDRERLRELYHKGQLLDEIFDVLPAHLFVKDANGRHRYISDAYFEDDIDEFLDYADPEMEMVESNHAWRAFEEDMHVIESGDSIVDKEEYLPKLDQWNLTSKVPWTDDDGETVGLIGVTRDISKWKRREQEIRRQNERLAAFSELVSHDLRNPLQVARSALTLAEEECDSEHLERVADAHERIDSMIDDVLTLAKYGQTVLDTEPVALADVVVQAWGTVGSERATLSVDEDLWTIECDPNQLQRLLENLFRNVVEHATDEEGRVTVRVEFIDRSDVHQPGSEPRYGFAVIDDGPGIPPDRRQQIREPGYTMSAEGTGFGLAIVEEIVDAHGWDLTITDGAEGGARFEIVGVERTD